MSCRSPALAGHLLDISETIDKINTLATISTQTLRGIVLSGNNRHLLVAVCLCVANAACAVAADPVDITTWVEKAVSCKQRDGAAVFHLTVGLTYTNLGTRSLIVPLFGIVSGYRILDRSNGKVTKWGTILTDLDGVSPDIWDGATPDSRIFDILMPGQTSRAGTRMQAMAIAGPVFGKRGLRPSGEYSIYLEIDHGRRSPGNPAISSEKWSDIGLLLTERVEASAVNFHIPAYNPAQACSEPPFISIKTRR
jgi:hypothetical protein